MRATVFSIEDTYVVSFKMFWASLMKTKSIFLDVVPVFILQAEILAPGSSEWYRFLEAIWAPNNS